MSEFLSNIAEKCTSVMNDPESKINTISEILSFDSNKELIYLSLAKVFKNIIPLYKIRLHSDKIKHKIDENPVTKYDKDLFEQYNKYLKEICSSNIPSSYRSACELLKTVDHFNFADRLVSKVLLGTTEENSLGLYCIETLVDRIKNDITGDTVFMIINQCLDYRYSFKIVNALLESKYLAKCVGMRIEKEEKYEKNRIKLRDLDSKSNKQKGFFKKNSNFSHSQKKEIKKSLIQLGKTKDEENKAMETIEDKNYIKTVNALQRLYFSILKNKMSECYIDVIKGILKYIRIIRKEFYEGLYILLNDTIKEGSIEVKIEGIFCILKLYSTFGYDFKNILDYVFEMIHPLNFSFEVIYHNKIFDLIKILFIENKQSYNRASAISQRLIMLRCLRYVPQIENLIKDIEVAYDLDFTENDYRNKKVASTSNFSDIDKIDQKPFYEYYLFKKLM